MAGFLRRLRAVSGARAVRPSRQDAGTDDAGKGGAGTGDRGKGDDRKRGAGAGRDVHGRPAPGCDPPSSTRGRRLWSALSERSVARQVFALQLVIVVLLVVAAVAALVIQANNDNNRSARARTLDVAQSFAHAPGTARALHSSDPTAVLQPRTEAARKRLRVDAIVVASPSGIRYTHPDRSRIGKRLTGPVGPPRRVRIDTVDGAIGPVVRALVPVTDPDGRIVGRVSVAIKEEQVSAGREMAPLLIPAAVALALATAGAALVSRRLRRQTKGLGPLEMTRMYEHHDAVLHAVHEGVVIVDGEGRLLLANDEAKRLLDLPSDVRCRHVADLGLEPRTAELLASGRVATDEILPGAGERLLAVNSRPTGAKGGPPGFVATFRDATELRLLSGRVEAARRRLRLLYDATGAIGTTLDVTRTAEELAQFAVPRLADYVTVDLAEPVLSGDEPRPSFGSPRMRRTAFDGVRPDPPLVPVGELITYVASSSQARSFAGQAVLEERLSDAPRWRSVDPARTARVIEFGIHSLIAAPLRARGVLLGVVSFWRSEKPGPFEEEDLSLADELAARAALSIDNARRYTREHSMAITLQRRLLPRALPEQSAVQVATRYLPATGGVSGDWFDVIPLPGARVALVMGDVVGRGLHAAATMGRLRTAVHNFSTLDVPPDELLAHLDELVVRIDQDALAAGDEAAITGATCLYAVYDPVSRLCVTARAGHPAPALVRPDGTVDFPDVPAGPPLGVGGLPFEAAEMRLEEGSMLVVYTDGLVARRGQDVDSGLRALREVLERVPGSPEETCDAVVEALVPAGQRDDVALLVARTDVLAADQVAEWAVESDPAAVAEVRAGVAANLADWGLEDIAFTTELILSELLTNAIQHATAPVRVRLLRDRARLVCEVADSSSTSPHLRYAATTDEGGRGLFLVAQLADRWGTRYTKEGKVIWTEQALPGSGDPDAEDPGLPETGASPSEGRTPPRGRVTA
ncbi:GAF domain-containing protein [Streptomyces sp. Amel2xB2]|uniref:SpoIIE family protein phosphatase n=1 Tax=Streptomyces sp. Amel2xB2 TaxID=1305829 RepID=UPI000DBA9BA2|nr:SpoIIE family protein phosphatase [Streptomyces sp. Amel2xB2]RAJ71318.1 GAF domain-containing protein [Streptomyces sp. Amel2xB2]